MLARRTISADTRAFSGPAERHPVGHLLPLFITQDGWSPTGLMAPGLNQSHKCIVTASEDDRSSPSGQRLLVNSCELSDCYGTPYRLSLDPV